MRFATLALVATLASTSLGAATLEDLSWMTGHWRTETEKGVTEELWMPAEGSVMLGLNRLVRPGRMAFFEFLRIEERDGAIAFVAQPGGNPPTSFPLVFLDGMTVVFENPDHDFPQRVIYERVDDRLCGRVEGKMDGKESSQEWCWTKVAE